MKKALISLRSYSVLLMISSLALSLIACGGARETTLKFPKLDEPKLPAYTGPRFRVALAPFETLKAAQPLLKKLGFEGVEAGLTELATNQLVKAGYLQVLERSRLSSVTSNQDVEANAELFDQSTTQKKGGFVGAEYTLVGTIEEVEPNLSKTDLNAGLPELAEIKGSLTQASVRLGLRLVHTGTGEILAAGTGHGVMKTGGIGLSINMKGASVGLSSKGSTPLGFAFNAALYQSIADLAKKLTTSPWSCRVAGAKESRVIIECGVKHRIKKGMVFTYYSRNGEITDANGNVIGFDEEENGKATVMSVQAKASVARHEGTKPPKAGDAVVFEQ